MNFGAGSVHLNTRVLPADVMLGEMSAGLGSRLERDTGPADSTMVESTGPLVIAD